MSRDVFTVKGMTCGHCVKAVKSEVSRIDGVSAVDVELQSGRVTVDSQHPLDREALRLAVEEAGYELVS
jgi:copper chaperone